MADLRAQLESALQGRVCIMGVGNVAYGDDGFGVRLAEALQACGIPDVIVAEKSPERWVGRISGEHFQNLLFLDAVELAATPGSLLLLDGREIEARFPQISTHKISLGLLAQCVEDNGARAWLLGVQPESLRPCTTLSSTMQTTLDAVCELLCELMSAQRLAPGRPG